MSGSLAELLNASPFTGYVYAYPHKTAYRPLNPPRPLADVWRDEDKSSLFLYLHVPFCEMRCGFCNLFTQSHSREGLGIDLQSAYLDALERQVAATRDAIFPASFSRAAIGGGTPTFMDVAGLQRLFRLMREALGAPLDRMPLSVETSPFTATTDRLQFLRENGVTRLSIGVQSFIEAEVASAGRAQKRSEVELALTNIRAARFPVLNIDLIYGLPGQSVSSWLDSVRAALEWKPEELYLYPLYVRPLTGLGRRKARATSADSKWDALRLQCSRAARDLLRAEGYTQQSMRHFSTKHAEMTGANYCCQEDGMVGLGCGSRSYTHALHYSTEYAVSANGVGEILRAYLKRSSSDFSRVDYGFDLDGSEQRRRYVLKSLLHSAGLDLAAYRENFGADAREDFPELRPLVDARLAECRGSRMTLTESGIERSDAIGPWLASAGVCERMGQFELR
jgi:oxygen-independent coproporphyrinogen III oxidase